MRKFVYEMGLSPKEIADKAINFLYSMLYNSTTYKKATFGGAEGSTLLRDCVYRQSNDALAEAEEYLSSFPKCRGSGTAIRYEFIRVFKILINSNIEANSIVENDNTVKKLPANGIILRIWHRPNGEAGLGDIDPDEFDVTIRFDDTIRQQANKARDGWYQMEFKPLRNPKVIYINKIRFVKESD